MNDLLNLDCCLVGFVGFLEHKDEKVEKEFDD